MAANLDDANENPESILLRWVRQKKGRDEVVHALAVCEEGEQVSGSRQERERAGRTADFGVSSRVSNEDISQFRHAGAVTGEEDVRGEGAVTWRRVEEVSHVVTKERERSRAYNPCRFASSRALRRRSSVAQAAPGKPQARELRWRKSTRPRFCGREGVNINLCKKESREKGLTSVGTRSGSPSSPAP